MANAARDENSIPTLLAISDADGTTPVKVAANPATHALDILDNSSGSDLSGDVAARDDNGVPVLIGVSSDDGVTPVPVYADPTTGALKIKST